MLNKLRLLNIGCADVKYFAIAKCWGRII